MEEQTKIRLTAAKMFTLWTQYLNDTVSGCMNSHFLEKVEDSGVRPIIEWLEEPPQADDREELIHG